MQISKSDFDKGSLLILNGDLIGENVGTEILGLVNDVIQNDTKALILEVSDVRYMNSSGIGVLITVHTKLKNVDGEVILVNPNEQILKVLDITKLRDVFTIVDSIEEAKDKIG